MCKRILLFLLILIIGLPLSVFALEPPPDKQKKSIEETKETEVEPAIEDQGFIYYGPLSISLGYKVSRDKRHIIYKIMNNTGQSIDRVFGRIYQVERDDMGRVTRSFLANNPNAGGILISKRPHKPSTSGTWRFSLENKTISQNTQYLLKVNNRSIFFTPFEIKEAKIIRPQPPGEAEETPPDQL